MSFVEGGPVQFPEIPKAVDDAFSQFEESIHKRPGMVSSGEGSSSQSRSLIWNTRYCSYSLSAAIQEDPGLRRVVLRLWETAWKDDAPTLLRRRLAETEAFVGIPTSRTDFIELLDHLDQQTRSRQHLLDDPAAIETGEVLITRIAPSALDVMDLDFTLGIKNAHL